MTGSRVFVGTNVLHAFKEGQVSTLVPSWDKSDPSSYIQSLWQPQLPSSAARHKKRKKDNRPTFKYRSRARKKCSPESSTAQDSGQIA